MKHIIAVLMENEPGALSRVVGLFSARGYNIESLTVAPTEDASLSRMTIQTTGSDDIFMVSRNGMTIRFSEDDARSMGRDTSGVRGMDVKGDNEVIAMDIARDDQYLLVVTENGFGKRTPVADYRKTSRGAKGVKTIQMTEAKGGLAAALVVRDHHQLVFISQNGMVQRIAVRELRPLGRNAQGFRLMNVRDDDRVSAVALVVESEAEDAVAVDEPVSLDASGTADETGLAGDGVIAADPADDSLLDVPEVAGDEMPDSDLEE